MNRPLTCSLLLAIAFTFSMCDKGTQFDGYTRAESGLHYKFYNHNDAGAKPQLGDFLKLKWAFKLHRNDSTFMDSHEGGPDKDGYAQVSLMKVTFEGSLEEGILLMSSGDSASFIVPADSFFLKTMSLNELPKFARPGDYVRAQIKLGEIMSKEKVEADRKKQMEEQEAKMKEMADNEAPALEKYLADNNIKTKPTATGLIVIETKKGSGPKPKAGDIVEVNYVGRLLDGTLFDTSIESLAKENNVYNPQRPYEPIKFPVGTHQVIQGWDEGLAMLSKGSKARFIIPSRIGYGPSAQGMIPPFSTLVFEVELVNFTPGPPPQQVQSQPATNPASGK